MNFSDLFHAKHSGADLGQLKSIQALRGLAALAVMLAHMHGAESNHSASDTLLGSAWIVGVSGVDLFFVISGFIMVWIAGDLPAGLRTAGKFLFSRVLRIYPLWWVFATITAGAYAFVLFGVPWDADAVGRDATEGIIHLVKSYLLIPQDTLPVLFLGWTLIHEMYFYVVFAGILMLPKSYRMPACALWAAIILAATITQATGFHAGSWISLALFPLTLEFLMGAAVAWLLKAGLVQLRWPALIIGGIWLLVAARVVDFNTPTPSLPTLRTFAFGPAFALLVYAAVTFEQSSEFGRHIPKALVRLGDWSYSLYLSHLLVLSAVGQLYFGSFGREGYVDNFIFVILSASLAIAISGLSFTFFERPLSRASHRLRKTWFREASAKITTEP